MCSNQSEFCKLFLLDPPHHTLQEREDFSFTSIFDLSLSHCLLRRELPAIMEPALTAMAVRFAIDCLLKLLPGVRSIDSYAELGKKIETLRSKLQAIREMRRDADEGRLMGHAVNDWIRKLKDVACEAEDVLDSFDTEELRRRSESQLYMKVRDFFSRNQIVFRIRITHSIEAVNMRLGSVIDEKSFQLSGATGSRKEDEQISSSYIDESEVIGRDEDKKKIVTLLSEDNDSERVSVVFIVGIGGIGKTTLAQQVYDDKSVRKHFEDMVMWKEVGAYFSLKTLMASILELATKKRPESLEMDLLQLNLREALAEKKFLLVLDDVWNVEDIRWRRLFDMLQSGKRGSKVIVTTRLEGTLWNMSTSNCHTLEPLSNEHCWSLFKRFAFDDRDNHNNLLDTGKQIVKKCRGVPLAAMAVGGMMRSRKDKSEWLEVLNSEIWEPSEGGDRILSALMLSYDDLTTEYKQCFAFCSIFPKGFEIEKENLILLWMANNFISSSGKHEVEAVGHRVFINLLRRSFFQEGKKDADGNISKCKMHDLMNDLARRITGDEGRVLGYDIESTGYDTIESIQRRTRYMSIEQSPSADILNALLCKPSSLRTLLTQKTYRMDPDILLCIFTKLRFLRALDLCDNDIREFPVSVDKLKHLRYLNLSENPLTTLPNSIVHLLNLQSLILRQCNFLRELPKNLSNLKNLRHLDISGCICLTHMPSGLAQLTHLHKLTDFVVGKDTGCSIAELERLKIYGNINIVNLENIANENIPDRKILLNDYKQYLKSLKLYWGNATNSIQNAENLLESLEPHSNLKRLNVSNYGGSRFPNWLANNTISDLVEIKLINCTYCENLPQLGNLGYLTEVQIIGMRSVKIIDENFYGDKGFPALKQFSLSDMPILEQWRGFQERVIFPSLEMLIIGSCPVLKEVPSIPRILYFEMSQCHANLLSSVGSLTSLSSLVVKELAGTCLPSQSLRNLTALMKLDFNGCTMAQSSMLKKLGIDNCSSLTDLPGWMAEIRSLEYISIHNCPLLKVLPEWFQNLNELQVLSIRGCPELQSRCKRETGADWQKISHVPVIEIDLTSDAPNTNNIEITTAVSDRRNRSSFGSLMTCCTRS